MRKPLASIVLVTRNGAATLPALLDAIDRQRVDFAFDVVAVDSSSVDGTAELLRERAATFLSIRPESFDHGATRNLAIAHSHGDLIVLIVQDAVPASEGWLEALTAPLRADPTLAGVFARQIPRPDASALARWHLERWAGASLVPRTVALTAAEFDAMSPRERLERCTFDNVCSCIRRSVWLAHPFRATPMAEDLEWARDVLLAGYRLAYAPAAAVIHSHDRSIRYEFMRTRLLHRRLRELFGLRAVPTAIALARAVATTVVAHLQRERSLRAAALGVVWPLGQYLGGRSVGRVSTPAARAA